jgi:hypothetical protein
MKPDVLKQIKEIDEERRKTAQARIMAAQDKVMNRDE